MARKISLIDSINCNITAIDWKAVIDCTGDASIRSILNIREQDEELPYVDNFDSFVKLFGELERPEDMSHEKIKFLTNVARVSSAPELKSPILFYHDPQHQEILSLEFIPGEKEVLYKTFKYGWNPDTALFILNNQQLPPDYNYNEDVLNQESEVRSNYIQSLCRSTINWSRIESFAALESSFLSQMQGIVEKVRSATSLS